MDAKTAKLLAAVAVIGCWPGAASAQTGDDQRFFTRKASFPVAGNLPEAADPNSETSAEIVAATADGATLIYTDGPQKALGFIDLSDPAAPAPLAFAPLGAEPTAVAVSRDAALVAINTSESFVEPSGELAFYDIASRERLGACDLGGQPDSVAVAPDGGFVAVAIENERNEDLNDGVIPQAPAGFVAILDLGDDGAPVCSSLLKADVTNLADVAPSDPEPEFVDINAAGEIAVTLQENNHIVVLDKAGKVVSHFSAGEVNLRGVDLQEEGALTFDGVQPNRKREPDAIQWLDDDRLVVANEGDYEGGSRGFTIFSKSGDVLYESGLDLEYRAARAGHYPEKRSGNKGVEPEGLEVGEFGGVRYIFVLLERSSLVGVYKDTGGAPEFAQLLPSGVGPEGALALPGRNLFVTANEVDLGPDGGPRAHVMIYEFGDRAPEFPDIVSVDDAEGRPIGWGALSGLVADADESQIVYAVGDSFYRSQPSIFEIATDTYPAVIRRRIPITRDGAPAQLLDLEGVAQDGDGGFWLASEGRADRLIPHALYRVDATGEIVESVPFPPELLAHQRRFGAEGVTRIGDRLWIAMQREWGDDPKGLVKLLSYDTKTKEWGAVRYPLQEVETGWAGLSEISYDIGHVYIVERDNQAGEAAQVKAIYTVPIDELKPAPLGEDLPVVDKTLFLDLLEGTLQRPNGFVLEKIEGLAISGSIVTIAADNDGVDDSSGETIFIGLDKFALE